MASVAAVAAARVAARMYTSKCFHSQVTARTTAERACPISIHNGQTCLAIQRPGLK